MHNDFPMTAPTSSNFHHHQQNDFTLDNFRLPPGITLTRVEGVHAPAHPELPVRMVDRSSNKRDNTSSATNTNPTGPNPIIVTNPPKAKESMGSLGGLAAPNVIVVDTRKIQQQPPQQQHQQKAPVQMCSVAVQTGWDENDVDESQLSKKQRKKLRRKQEQEQQAMMEQLAALQLNKKAAGKAANNKTLNNPSNGTAKQPNPAPTQATSVTKTTSSNTKSKNKKKRSSTASGQSGGEDKWDEENVFVPKSDLDLEGGDLDEDERELEAFKRFCFNTVPPERKEKVRIHLNVKDIFGKKSTSSNGGGGGGGQHSTSCK